MGRGLAIQNPLYGYEIDIQHLKNSIFPQMMTMIAMTMTRMEARGQQQRWRRRSMAGASQLDCDVGASSVSPQLAQRGGGSHTTLKLRSFVISKNSYILFPF